MSLLIFYHGVDRIVVAADRRVTAEKGGRLARVATAPKFMVLGNSIIAAVGRANHVAALLSRVARVAAERPTEDLVTFLRSDAVRLWETRTPAPDDGLARFDNLGVFAAAFDERAGRMRLVGFTSENDFDLVEPTADQGNVISPAGFVTEADFPLLQDLAFKMADAPKHPTDWIASALRDTGNELACRHPEYVDPMADFAALGRDGVIRLPACFPAPSPEIKMARVQ